MWIHVYERPRKYSRISYSDGVKAVLALPQYQKNKKTTVIYFPGWIENPQNKESVNYVTDGKNFRMYQKQDEYLFHISSHDA